MKKTDDERIPTIKYEEKLEETVIHLNDDHENEITKRIDSLTLDKPMFLIRKNIETWAEEGLVVTERILNFLKENKNEELVYDIYINYSFCVRNSIEEMEDNEDIAYYNKISEDEFIESEKKCWEETKQFKGTPNPLLNAVKFFHNMKWHNGEEFWKYDRGENDEEN